MRAKKEVKDNTSRPDRDELNRQAQMNAVWQRIQRRLGAESSPANGAPGDKIVNVAAANGRRKLPIIICLVIASAVSGVAVTGYLTNWFGLVKPDRHYDQVTVADLIDTSTQMPGVKFEDIPNTTKVTILSSNIQAKLDGYQDYNIDRAIADYQQVYDVAEGELKLYVALEYANYLYDNTHDLDRAVAIIDSVKDLTGDDHRVDYYSTLVNLYNKAGDQQKADEYNEVLQDIMPFPAEGLNVY